MKGKLTAVAVCLGLCVLLTSCMATKEYLPKPIQVQDVTYRTYTVEKGNISRRISESGTLALYEYQGEECFVVEYTGVNRSILHMGDTMQVGYAGETFFGTVIQTYEAGVSPARILVEGMNGLYRIFIGKTCTLNGVLEEKTDVISLPKAYVKLTDGKAIVRILTADENGVLQKSRIYVTIGLETGDRYEITSGLSEGDLVVID